MRIFPFSLFLSFAPSLVLHSLIEIFIPFYLISVISSCLNFSFLLLISFISFFIHSNELKYFSELIEFFFSSLLLLFLSFPSTFYFSPPRFFTFIFSHSPFNSIQFHFISFHYNSIPCGMSAQFSHYLLQFVQI